MTPSPYRNTAMSSVVVVFWSISYAQATHLAALQIHVNDQGDFGSKSERCLMPDK
jgi:hypothetical protein